MVQLENGKGVSSVVHRREGWSVMWYIYVKDGALKISRSVKVCVLSAGFRGVRFAFLVFIGAITITAILIATHG